MKKSQLERMLKVETEMRTHFEDLFNTALSEFKFTKLQVKVLLNAIEETKVLLDEEVDSGIIINVLTNYLERMNLDINIHNNLMNNSSSGCGVNGD